MKKILPVDFEFVGRISNADAQKGVPLSLAAVSGIYDTVWLVDDSISPGAFDVDAVRVTPVPLPGCSCQHLGHYPACLQWRRPEL